MPNKFDFSKLENKLEIEISPNGWITPLIIEYGMYIGQETQGINSCCWRVKGTSHTFMIPIIRLDFLSSGNYKRHFENVLELFKEDYIKWKNEKFITQWSKEYRDEYSRFIVI